MMKLIRAAGAFITVMLALVSFQGSAFAQDDSATAAADPPSRVARLSYLSGEVSFEPNGVDDWVAATLNRPMTTSDRLWTYRGARAELQTDTAIMRLDGEASFTLANLDDQRVQIQLAQGVLNVTLYQLEPNETFEVDTPNFTLNLLRGGEYRIQVDNANDVSWAIVRSGSAEVTSGPQALTLQPGQQARFAGSDGRSYAVDAAPGQDGFDQWCNARDQRIQSGRSEHVARGVIGAEDLDSYGKWRTYEDYGSVWVPTTVVAGWAPYRYGHWAWIYPWGWTWVDDAPWGFAPFHYGRWIHAGFGWAWVPGPVYVRPVYAPALVAWCGGSGWSIGASFGGGVGWFPLGPREPFIPWYWGSRHYFSRVNITNTRIINVNNYYNNYYYPRWRHGHDGPDRPHDWHAGDVRTITNIDYANRRAPNGVTFVNHDSFVNGRPVAKSTINIPRDKLRGAPVVSNVDAKPEIRSVLGAKRDEDARLRPPRAAFGRPVVSRSVAPKPLPFDDQARNFSAPRSIPNPQTRTFADGNGRTLTHVTVTAPRENAGVPPQQNSIRPGDTVAGRPSVPVIPRPLEQQIQGGGNDAPSPEPKQAEGQGSANRERWAVPQPPFDGRPSSHMVRAHEDGSLPTQPREPQVRNNAPAPVQRTAPTPEVRQGTNIDHGRGPADREYRPPVERPAQRPAEPPQRPTVVRQSHEAPAPPRPSVQQRVEQRPAEPRRVEAPHVEHAAQSRPSRPAESQHSSPPTQGGRRSQ